MTRALKEHSLPVQIEGFPYILGGLLLAISSAIVWKSYDVTGAPGLVFGGLTVLFSIFTLFSVWFYRCPHVHTPTDDAQAVLSPACGRVLSVTEVAGGRIGEPKAKKVSIFMSPVDV